MNGLSKEQLARLYNLNPKDYDSKQAIIDWISWFKDETAFKKANDKLSFLYEQESNQNRT